MWPSVHGAWTLKGNRRAPAPSPALFLFTIHYSPLCRFSLPLLVAVSIAASRRRLAKQNHCVLQYRRPIADVEGIGELKLVSHCSSRGDRTKRSYFQLFTASRFTLLFPLLLPPVIAENLIQNCQLNQLVVR
jgi:hypothetical protein